MRYIGLVSALALGVAALQSIPAGAQQSGSPTGDLLDRALRAGQASQWSATRRTPLSTLSHTSKEWMKAEAQRQAAAPRKAIEVAVSIDESLARDIRRLAQDEGVRPNDVSNAILLQIMIDAQDILTHDLRQARAGATPVANNPAEEDRLLRADLDRRAAMEMQTPASLALVMM